jgi:secreted PhoX family phosphatase
MGIHHSGEMSRRGLLGNAACAVGAGVATMLATTMNANAAKMSQKNAAYQSTPKGSQRCDNCTLFVKPSACVSVEGPIAPAGWCALYVPKKG